MLMSFFTSTRNGDSHFRVQFARHVLGFLAFLLLSFQSTAQTPDDSKEITSCDYKVTTEIYYDYPESGQTTIKWLLLKTSATVKDLSHFSQRLCAPSSALLSATTGGGIEQEPVCDPDGGDYLKFNNSVGSTTVPTIVTIVLSGTDYVLVELDAIYKAGNDCCYGKIYGVGCCVINPGSIGNAQSICEDDDPTAISSVTGATGSGDVSYKWEMNTTGCDGSWTEIEDATGATYDPGPLTVTTYYRRVAINSEGTYSCTEYSNCITITVQEKPEVDCPDDMTVCVTDDDITLSGATPEGGTYSGTGVTNGIFDPAAAGVGEHTITYTYSNGTCENTCTFTITVQNCDRHIFPTGTTCDNFQDQNVSPLEQLCFTRNSSNIVTNASAPGAWFYYTYVTKPAGVNSITVKVNQTNDGNIDQLFTTREIKAWTSACTQITKYVTTDYSNPSVPMISISGLGSAEQTIVISVKYNSKSIVGGTVTGSAPVSSVYSFSSEASTGAGFAAVPGSGETLTAYECGITNSVNVGSPVEMMLNTSKAKVIAYPNPFNAEVNFRFISEEKGRATLEVYDQLGRKLTMLFQGEVEAGSQRDFKYLVPSTLRNSLLIYKLTLNGKVMSGRLIPAVN